MVSGYTLELQCKSCIVVHRTNSHYISQDGFTPLMLASNNGHTEAVIALLDHVNTDATIQDSVRIGLHLTMLTHIVDCTCTFSLSRQGGNTALSVAESVEIEHIINAYLTNK